MIKRNGCMTKLAMLRWRNKRFSIRGWTITPQLIKIWVLWDPSIKITATLNSMLSREYRVILHVQKNGLQNLYII